MGGRQKSTGTNSTYKKLAVQCLIEALCFVSSVLLADSFVLRNRQLLVAANDNKSDDPFVSVIHNLISKGIPRNRYMP
jgi:hypothetical protein